MKTVKIDYTLTPEFFSANLEGMERSYCKVLDSIEESEGRSFVSNPNVRSAHKSHNEYLQVMLASIETLKPLRKPESLARTVCKIAARILFVLLLVGVAVGVML